MKYKILNKLFGWDYISWSNTADNGIARVHKDYEGNAYFFRYKITKLIDYIEDYSNNRARRIIWLTCSPEKYINKKGNAPAKHQNKGNTDSRL